MIPQTHRGKIHGADEHPDIIQRKIYWYIWKNKQNKINEEYKKTYNVKEYITTYDLLHGKNGSFSHLKGKITKDESHKIYNWRGVHEIYDKVWDKNDNVVGKISKNYYSAILYKN